jgi:radical SAM superfamily enzyme YgiQ (UPF0313 family)
MKLALVSPRSSFLGRHAQFINFLNQSPEMAFYRHYWSGLGLGLLIIGALTPDDVAIELIDENIEEIDFKKDYDIVAITAMTQQATRAYEIAKRFRGKNTTVVLGGIHPTVLPDEAKLHGNSVVVGEAENLWSKLLADFEHNKLRDIYATHQEVSLNESPIPRYSLLEEKPYKIVWVQATRGCPHNCTFCCASKVYGSKLRHKSISQVMAEIGEIRSINQHALIGFSDDNLLCDKKFSSQLIEKTIDMKIRWIGQSDISVAHNRTLLKLIKRSGCVALIIGLESINEENLRGLDSSNWKMKHLKNYAENIRHIQNEGIGVIGTFIVGFDNDDNSTFDNLVDFIIGNHLVGAQISALTPFPSTRVRERLLREGRILDTPWENYTLYDVNIRPKKMSPMQLEQGVLKAFQKIYSPEVAVEKAKYFKHIFSRLSKEFKENLLEEE